MFVICERRVRRWAAAAISQSRAASSSPTPSPPNGLALIRSIIYDVMGSRLNSDLFDDGVTVNNMNPLSEMFALRKSIVLQLTADVMAIIKY